MSNDMEHQRMADTMESSLVIPIPKKGDSRKCSNYKTIILINHAAKYY